MGLAEYGVLHRPLLPFTYVCDHSLLLLRCPITMRCTSTHLADEMAVDAALAIQPKTYLVYIYLPGESP